MSDQLFDITIPAVDPDTHKPWRKRLEGIDAEAKGGGAVTGPWVDAAATYQVAAGTLFVGADPTKAEPVKTRVRVWVVTADGELETVSDKTYNKTSAFGAKTRGVLAKALVRHPFTSRTLRPVTAAPVRTNERADYCNRCRTMVAVGEGVLERNGRFTNVVHKQCPPKRNRRADSCRACGGWLDIGEGVLTSDGIRYVPRHEGACPPPEERKPNPTRAAAPPAATAGPEPAETGWKIDAAQEGPRRIGPASPFTVGQVLRAAPRGREDIPTTAPGYLIGARGGRWAGRPTAIVVVTSLMRSEYIRDEDGDTPSDELIGTDGWWHRARVRLATEEEAAPLLDAEVENRAARQRQRRIRDLIKAGLSWRYTPLPDGHWPEHADLTGTRLVWRGEPTSPLSMARPDEIWADDTTVWSVYDNGADGDDWGHNNLPGRVAHSHPLTDERAAMLAELDAYVADQGEDHSAETPPVTARRVPAEQPPAPALTSGPEPTTGTGEEKALARHRPQYTTLDLDPRTIRRHPRDLRRTPNDPELADSIREVGILQPPVILPADRVAAAWGGVVAQELAGSEWVMFYGHQRLAAALDVYADDPDATIPVLLRTDSIADDPMAQFDAMCIENTARRDLTPMEEAFAYGVQREEGGRSERQIAVRVGRSQGHIHKRLQLLKLPAEVQHALETRLIDVSDANEFLKLTPELHLDAWALVEETTSADTFQALTGAERRKTAKKAVVTAVRTTNARAARLAAEQSGAVQQPAPPPDGYVEAGPQEPGPPAEPVTRGTPNAGPAAPSTSSAHHPPEPAGQPAAVAPVAELVFTPPAPRAVTRTVDLAAAADARARAAGVLAADPPKLTKVAAGIVDALIGQHALDAAGLVPGWLAAAGTGPDPALPTAEWWRQVAAGPWAQRVHAAHGLALASREARIRAHTAWDHADAEWVRLLEREADHQINSTEAALLEAAEAR